MNNLWKKETGKAEYIDPYGTLKNEIAPGSDMLIELNNILSNVQINQKDNQRSSEWLSKGNKHFDQENWQEAAKCYTKSLCFAEIGTQNDALAYSKRSACYFNMEFFEEALVDIELAKKADPPDHLISMLNQRESDSVKTMSIVERKARFEAKLSYEANENFPCMANIVEIKYNEEFGRHLVAKRAIPSGRTVLFEKIFRVTDMPWAKPWVCYSCSKGSMNWIACSNCSAVIFCDANCMNSDQTHKFECGTFFSSLPLSIRFQIKTILFAITTFNDVESLIHFVEETLLENSEKLPTTLNDSKSRYHFFFKLSKSPPYPLGPMEALKTYEQLMNLPKVGHLFDTIQKKRFLMHLAMHHTFITRSNVFANEESMYITNIISLLNHACKNNIKMTIMKGHLVGESIVSIKKGQQLFINYDKSLIELQKDERKNKLLSEWGFLCKCKMCN